MATVSITQAAKLSGISRATFYRKYINTGVLSVATDANGHKQIDTSELLRVFPDLKLTDTKASDDAKAIDNDKPDQSAEVELLRQQLQESKERENWYRQQIAEEKARAIEEKLRAERAEIKLLEHLAPDVPKQNNHWWQFWK